MNEAELQSIQQALKLHAPMKLKVAVASALPGTILFAISVRDLILKPFALINLLGSAIGLFSVVHFAVRYRKDRVIAKKITRAKEIITRLQGLQ